MAQVVIENPIIGSLLRESKTVSTRALSKVTPVENPCWTSEADSDGSATGGKAKE